MREVLRNKIYFTCALHFEQLCLANQLTECKRAVLPAHQGNRAKCTAVIATFADLEVANMRKIARIDAYARMHRDRVSADDPPLCQLLCKPPALGCAEEQVD